MTSKGVVSKVEIGGFNLTGVTPEKGANLFFEHRKMEGYQPCFIDNGDNVSDENIRRKSTIILGRMGPCTITTLPHIKKRLKEEGLEFRFFKHKKGIVLKTIRKRGLLKTFWDGLLEECWPFPGVFRANRLLKRAGWESSPELLEEIKYVLKKGGDIGFTGKKDADYYISNHGDMISKKDIAEIIADVAKEKIERTRFKL